MDYSDNKGPRITGYQVQNSVAVTLRNLAKTGELIDAALGAARPRSIRSTSAWTTRRGRPRRPVPRR